MSTIAFRNQFRPRAGVLLMLVLAALAALSILQHATVDHMLRSTAGKEALAAELDKQRLALKRSLLVAYAYRSDGYESGLAELAEAERSFTDAYDTLLNDWSDYGDIPAGLRAQLVAGKPEFDDYFRDLRERAADPARSLPRLSESLALLDSLTDVVADYDADAKLSFDVASQLVWPSAFVHVAIFALLAVFAYRNAIASDQESNRTLYLKAAEYAKVYDDSPFFQYEVDADGFILKLNKTFADAMGYRPEEMVGTTIFEYLVDGDRIRDQYSARDYELKMASVQREFIRADSHAIPVTLFAVSAEPTSGSNRIQVTAFDRSGEESALLAASSARARRENSFAVAPIPMFAATPDGTITDANPCLLETLQATSIDEVNEMDLRHIISVTARRKPANEGTNFKSKQTLFTRNNVPLDVILHLWVFDVGGNTTIEGAFIDVTELETIRRQLHTSRNRFRRLYDETPVMLCSLDSAGFLVDANESMTKLLDRPRTDLFGKKVDDLFVDDDRDEVVARIEECKSTRSVVNFSAHCRLDGGSPVPVQVYLNPRVARGRSVGSMLVTILDCTEIEAAQRERDQIASRLRMAEKLEAVGQLAAGIAHEINTPSQYVSDNLTFLQEACTDILSALHEKGSDLLGDDLDFDLGFYMEELPPAVEQSLEGIAQIKRIVRAMKEFSHPGSDEKEPTDLNRLIESVTTVARNEWKYVATLSLDLDPCLELVPCASSSMNQVILNIVVNAAHAMESKYNDGTMGEIRIETSQDSGFAKIVVRDTGSGIPNEIIEQIFNPFFTTKEVGKGTGQGLSIARQIITEEHGGTIEVESQAGEWTCFTIRLPNRPLEDAA